MKVLIIHDRKTVGEEIQRLIEDQCEGPAPQIVDNASDARASLSEVFYDLLIIDLTIPVISGREPEGFQVAEGLLEELVNSPTLLTPTNIVGITKDTDALDSVKNNIGPHLMAIISEDEDSRWKKQLSDRVHYIIRSTSSRSQSLLTTHDYDLLIVTALDKELAPFLSLFEVHDHETISGLSIFAFADRLGLQRRGACYSIGRAGQPSAASETQGLICQLRPKLAIMSGFCGGVPGKADLGDILFAESAADWDYGKWKPSETAAKLYSRPEPVQIRNTKSHRIARKIVANGILDAGPLDAALSKLSNNEISEAKFKLSPFASGSAVIGDKDVLASISSLNDSIGGVDMEAFGFYFACHHSQAAKPEFVCIKTVADDCGPEKDDRLHRACCFGSAHVAKVIATEMWDF